MHERATAAVGAFSALSDVDGSEDTGGNEVDLKARIVEALAALEVIATTNTQTLEKLHPIERMMLDDFRRENRHLNCTGCLRLLERLLTKLNT